MSDSGERLTKLIAEAKGDKAKVAKAFDLVSSMLQLGYHEGESMVFAVLRAGADAPAELLDWALENFMKTRTNRREQHGYWVHSVSHFTKKLWELRPAMDKWIKEINRVSFKGANELGDSNCSDRLIGDFALNARWDEDPADFHLTPENLGWMNWKYAGYAKARIEHGKFASELEFVRWQILQPDVQKSYRGEIQVKELQDLMMKFVELGGDIKEFDGFLKKLLTENLARLEAELPNKEEGWQKKECQESISKARATLATLL